MCEAGLEIEGNGRREEEEEEGGIGECVRLC